MKGVRACTACVRERSGCKLYVRTCRSHACVQGVRACKDCVQDVHEGVRASSATTPPPQPLVLPNHSSCPTTPPAQPLLLPNHSSHPTTTLPQPFFLPNHSSYPTTTLHQPLFLPNHFSSPTNPPPRPLLLPCVHARRACMQVVRAYTPRARAANTQQLIKLLQLRSTFLTTKERAACSFEV